jgi:hypothetical protein
MKIIPCRHCEVPARIVLIRGGGGCDCQRERLPDCCDYMPAPAEMEAADVKKQNWLE